MCVCGGGGGGGLVVGFIFVFDFMGNSLLISSRSLTNLR